ncbi:MAG: hypothetical protein GY778_09070 [bacterium]|nr:hypothetical protein [bacterium]
MWYRQCGRPGVALVVWAVAQAACWPVLAEQSKPGRSIQFDVIDGKFCARCTLQGPAGTVPANVMIDLGSRAPLLVHERTAKLLGIGRGTEAGLRFDDVELVKVPAFAAGLPVLEELTVEHAAELGEIPAVAIVGLPAFGEQPIRLDVGQGILTVLPPDELGAESDERPETDREAVRAGPSVGHVWTLPFEQGSRGYWLRATGPERFALRVQFVTSRWDTLIDSTVADLLGSPGGDLEPVDMGGIDLSQMVALRPEDLAATPEPHPDVVLGTNLLSHFIILLDLPSGKMRFELVRQPRFPIEERTYFLAWVDEDAEAIESFVKENPSSRLAAEAGAVLLALRLDEYPPVRESILRAVRLRAESTRPDRRASLMVSVADDLMAGRRTDRYELAAKMLGLGLEFAPEDLDAQAAHEIQARLGHIALRSGDLRQARRHLLSAAFGMPRHPLVNLWLGELYERSGKLTRAWSRYVQAAIGDNAPPEALAGLDRLNRSPAFRADFTMAEAEQLVEGRVLEFHPAGRYLDNTETPHAEPVRLIELFSCVDHPDTLASELAFGGLTEYFGKHKVAFVAYHLPMPELDPLVAPVSLARARFYGVEQTPTALFDGSRADPSGGGEANIDRVFAAYRRASLEPARVGGEWRLTGELTASDESITGRIELHGPQAHPDLRLHAILCEKVVMSPGANGILMHRKVARWAFTPAEGFEITPQPGRRAWTIGGIPQDIITSLDGAVTALEKERGIEFLMKPTYLDTRACQLVAFVQDRRSKTVLAACAVDVEPDAPGRLGESAP